MAPKPLSLFYIVYDDSDPLSYLLAWTVPVPYFIVACHFALLLFRRELWSAWFFVGYFVNELVNYTLKNIIQEHRPPGSYKSGYGMPSDHAQFMFFFFILFSLLGLVRCSFKLKFMKYLIVVGSFFVAALVCISRVYSGVHTVSQVSGGILVGIIVGLLWFASGHFVVAPFIFPRIARLSISKILLIKDTTHVKDILSVEYEAYARCNKTK